MPMVSVMVVENSKRPLWSAKNLLTSINYEIVFQTSNGFEAIEKFPAIKPDLVLLDTSLSKSDGMNVIKEITKNHPDSKIIVLTLLSDEKLITECKKLGAKDCITIPYKLKEFITLVTRVANSSQSKSKVAPVLLD